MALSLGRLKRLQKIRSMEEQQARTELERVNMALNAAETAVGEQLVQRTMARRASRAALLAGDKAEWHLAEAMREVSEWNLDKMRAERQQRAAAVEPARVVFMEKRRDDEQMKILRGNVQRMADAESKRLEQIAADEWYGQNRFRTGTDDAKNS